MKIRTEGKAGKFITEIKEKVAFTTGYRCAEGTTREDLVELLKQMIEQCKEVGADYLISVPMNNPFLAEATSAVNSVFYTYPEFDIIKSIQLPNEEPSYICGDGYHGKTFYVVTIPLNKKSELPYVENRGKLTGRIHKIDYQPNRRIVAENGRISSYRT